MKIFLSLFFVLFSIGLYGQQQTAPPAASSAVDAKHQAFETLVGQWTTTTKMVSKPAAADTATAEGKMILGGRYIWMETTGTQLGKPYSGIKIIGYDDAEQKYEAVWMDDQHNSMLQVKGVTNDNGKTFVFLGGSHDSQNRPNIVKIVLTIQDKDHHMWEQFSVGKDGKAAKVLEVDYTRK